jgi:serine phosphatase RsbU (regulator of sigma subunit)
VNERQLTDTGEILGSLHKNVLRALNEDISARQSKDGMDIALIRIDRASRTVQYSGAVRPLYHIENNQLQIIKGDRFSIGGVLDSEQEKFSSHIIDYTSPAMFYMFSDGIIDQFGLPAEAWANAGRAPASDKSMAGKEKKFMAKKLQDLLLSIASLPAEEQSSRIAAAINSWKGKLEQVDDMLVAGVRL